MAHLPNGNGYGGSSIVNGNELESTHNALDIAPMSLTEAAGRLAALRSSLIEVKQIKVVDAKVALEQSITGATMEAYGAGAITGKNQAERDLQVSAYLDGDERVKQTRVLLRHWEIEQAHLEARIEVAESDYKAAWARFAAARADAALQTAYLVFLAGQVEPEPETTNGDEFPKF